MIIESSFVSFKKFYTSFLYPVIVIDNITLSDDIVGKQQFVCDLNACKGLLKEW